MKLYANVNKLSKYAAQACTEPFEVWLKPTDKYCWRGNSNQYRTTDLDFYRLLEDGTFHKVEILDTDFTLLYRVCVEIKASLDQYVSSKDRDDRVWLYHLQECEAIKSVRELLDIFPKSRPQCSECEKYLDRCSCL